MVIPYYARQVKVCFTVMKFLHSTKFELILNRFCVTIENVNKLKLNVRRKAEQIADPLYIR